MSNHPNIDPWVETGATTAAVRGAAQELRSLMSNIQMPGGGRSEKDTALATAVQMLAMSADHIDRLHQDTERPLIVALTMSMVPGDDEDDNDAVYLYGTDNYGQLWQYNFSDDAEWTPGWLPLPSGRAVHVPPPQGGNVASIAGARQAKREPRK